MAGVRVGVADAARTPHRVPPLKPQERDCAAQRLDIPAVTVDKDQAGGPLTGRPAELHEQFRQYRGADRDSTGETFVLPAGAVRDGGGYQPAGFTARGKARSQHVCDRGRDAGIGIQRQVRSMLLSSTYRDDQRGRRIVQLLRRKAPELAGKSHATMVSRIHLVCTNCSRIGGN